MNERNELTGQIARLPYGHKVLSSNGSMAKLHNQHATAGQGTRERAADSSLKTSHRLHLGDARLGLGSRFLGSLGGYVTSLLDTEAIQSE